MADNAQEPDADIGDYVPVMFRIKLLNPDGEPAVMHRASFWFELFYDNTCK